MTEPSGGLPTLTEAGERAVRLFRYLRDLSELRTRAVRDIESYEQVVWFDDLPSDFGESIFEDSQMKGDDQSVSTWLKIDRVVLPDFPEPPVSLKSWLPGLMARRSDLDRPVVEDPEGLDQELSESLSDEFEAYLSESWNSWAKQHRRLLPAYTFYSTLFAMSERRRSLGEIYELVVGIGFLTWNSSQRIRRHLITSPCEIAVDSSTGRIEVRPTDTEGRNRLELDMLEADDRGPGDVVQILGDEVEQSDPLQLPLIAHSILERWINRSHADGSFEPSLSLPNATSSPIVHLAPAIILRKRGQRTLHKLLDDISRQIESGAPVPEGVGRLVLTGMSESEDGSKVTNLGFEDPELYFPLPSNEEQRTIVDRMSAQRVIVVQGPPGTGKSHTIANLTSHLLAQGKRVLITSHTERALHVLREKLPEEIRSLCVALLGSDRRAISELEGSVEEISFRKADWSDIESNNEVERLRNELDSLRKKRASAESKLRAIKESGSHPITLGQYRGTSQQIAREISAEAASLGWIADSIKDESPPLSNGEFGELVDLQFELSADADRLAALDLPPIEEVASPETLRRLFEDETGILAEKSNAQDLFGDWVAMLDDVDESVLDETAEALDAHAEILEEITDKDGWVVDARREILADRADTWRTLHDEVSRHQKSLEDAVERLGDVETAIDLDLEPSAIRHAVTELLSQVESGGTIRRGVLATGAARRHKEILGGLSVEGQVPTEPEPLNSLLARLDAEVSVEKLETYWAGRVDVSNQPTIPLKTAAYRVEQTALNRLLDLQRTKNACDDCYSSISSIPEPDWSDVEAIRRVIAGLKAVLRSRRLDGVQAEVSSSSQSLGDTNTDHLGEMRHAISARDVDAYTKAFGAHLVDLNESAGSTRRKELTDRLSTAPQLIESFVGTGEGEWDERAVQFDQAWGWRFANTALQELVDPKERRRQNQVVTETTTLERRCLEQLTAELAWSRMFRSITDEQSQALEAWAVAVKRIGRGTGKYVERHRHNARKYMGMARDAIPAWIMPTYRVAESLAAGPEQFDVVIVDEASQSGVEALFLFYLAKQVIVVGDDQQIAPEGVGIDMTSVHRLQGQHLQDIPFGDLFEPATSLYEQAKVRFPGPVILREHFRCMPEIIEFSNRVSYKHRTLTPMRQYGNDRLDPIKTVFLPHGYREGGRNAINRPEAEEVVARIQKLFTDPRYDDASLGVISLQGDSQARLIEQMLLDRIGPEKMLERSLVCGDAYAFQGDERNIIFMTMVAAPNQTPGALANEAAKRRFNVAASRAKDQVWLVHSVQPEDLSITDMRRTLIEYYKDPVVEHTDMPGDLDESVLNTPFESMFEQDVFGRIKSRGYRVVPQVPFAGYRIDLVIEGVGSKLAVECDGDEWHGAAQ
ncbi:MAG: AAA domain-containing protein, partial [Thermoanaerobaculia bacterium]